MSERRLIDIEALKEKEQYIPCGNGLLFHGVTAATIDAMPTIDPETLPIVRELREKLEQVTAERDAAIKVCASSFVLETESTIFHRANGTVLGGANYESGADLLQKMQQLIHQPKRGKINCEK